MGRRLMAVLLLGMGGRLAAAPAQEVPVRLDDGTVYGVLRGSTDPPELHLRRQGREDVIGGCGDEQLEGGHDLGHGLTAVAYVRNCGATVDYATHVAIRGASFSEVVAVFGGRPRVVLVARSGGLRILHSPVPPDLVFLRKSSAGRLSVSFETAGHPVKQTPQDRLEYSFLGYSATGRAAGLPKELLLRWAGWAQEASGMHRGEWGRWSGAWPYGIAPRTLSKIQEGFRHYELEYGRK